MSIGPGIGLSEAEKDVLLAQQQAMIERLVARISELEALVGKPRKTSPTRILRRRRTGLVAAKRGARRRGESGLRAKARRGR